MSGSRRYYVVKEGGQWVVMLEQGRNIDSYPTKGPAVERAKELGKRNNRAVMVNYADGRTGQQYYDYSN